MEYFELKKAIVKYPPTYGHYELIKPIKPCISWINTNVTKGNSLNNKRDEDDE